MSIALAVIFGNNFVVLGGDCEIEAWTALEADPTAPSNPAGVENVLDRVTFMKAPHHGSSRAWNPTLESCYRQCELAVATHHRRGSYCLPDADGIAKLRELGVTLAVPNRSFLPAEVQVAEDLPIQHIPVELGTRGGRRQARDYSERYGANVRSEPDDEVHWVSVSFDEEGRSSHLCGGSRAALLAPVG